MSFILWTHKGLIAFESCSLRCMVTLRFLVNDLREAPSNEMSHENTWPRSNDPTRFDDFGLMSWERSLRGIESYTSWPELLREVSSFLIASLSYFSENPWRSPWYHSWSLRFCSNWSSSSTSDWSLLIDVPLISKKPSLSELITLISNSKGACFSVTSLLICEVEVVQEGVESECLMKMTLKVLVLMISRSLRWWSCWLWKKTWRTNHLRVWFCWLVLDIILLLKQKLLTKIFEQHLIIWALLAVSTWFTSSSF